MLCFCLRLVGLSVGKRKSTSIVEAQLPGLWGPWRPALSPWTPKVSREQEEGCVGRAGLGTLWDRGVQPEAIGAHPVPGAQGRNFKTSALAQSSLTRPAGGRLAARSGTQGPAAGQPSLQVPGGWTGRRAEEGQMGGGGESPWSPLRGPTDPCGGTPSVEPRPSEPRPRGYHPPPRSHAPVEPHLAGPRPRRASPLETSCPILTAIWPARPPRVSPSVPKRHFRPNRHRVGDRGPPRDAR